MVLIVDNYGFTANITAAMVRSLGFSAVVLPFKTEEGVVNVGDYSAVILTAGPGSLAGNSLGSILVKKNPGTPLLGICQGMHLIARIHGAAVVKSALMCEDTLSHTGEGLFAGISQRFRVVLRHGHEIDRSALPREFEADAYSSTGAVQGISICGRKIYGTGFDPSNYRTENGIKIFYNFLNMK